MTISEESNEMRNLHRACGILCYMQGISPKKLMYSRFVETSVNNVLFKFTCCAEVTGQIAEKPRPREKEAGGGLHKGSTSDDAVFPQYVVI